MFETDGQKLVHIVAIQAKMSQHIHQELQTLTAMKVFAWPRDSFEHLKEEIDYLNFELPRLGFNQAAIKAGHLKSWFEGVGAANHGAQVSFNRFKADEFARFSHELCELISNELAAVIALIVPLQHVRMFRDPQILGPINAGRFGEASYFPAQN
jgi:hypothetical protein